MSEIDFVQILFLLFQSIAIAAILLAIFRLRKYFGLGMYFSVLGAIQYLQLFLSNTVFYEVYPNFFITPGSTIFFTIGLFAILITYIKEDANEARKVLYALLISNLILVIFQFIYKITFTDAVYLKTYTDFFKSERSLIAGTIVLIFDAFFLIFIFEWISRKIKSLFFRIFFTMLIITTFDSLAFSFSAYYWTDSFKLVFKTGIISKNIAVLIYSILFYFYIIIFEKEELVNEYSTKSFNDIFHTLTYREKYERVIKESAKAIKISQNRFQILAQISPVGIFQTDSEGLTTYVNKKWTEISGLSYEKALGNGWLQVVHHEDKSIIAKNWEKAARKKNSSIAEYRFLRPDGNIKWVIGIAVPEKDINQNIIGYVGTITDITELKLKEIELEKAKIKAEESDKMKTAFLQNISHEIRTPMNAIIGFSGLLINEKVALETKKEYVEIINQSCNQLLSIVDDIVNIATIESGNIKIKEQKIFLLSFLTDLLNSFELKIKQKGLILERKIIEISEDDYFFTDKVKLTQVISNLLQNAIKYTEKGKIVFYCKKNKKTVDFKIIDTGIGISLENIEKVFERFYQADNSLSKKYTGAGLGLSISKAYIEMLGGQIFIESTIEIGTTINFYIPFKN